MSCWSAKPLEIVGDEPSDESIKFISFGYNIRDIDPLDLSAAVQLPIFDLQGGIRNKSIHTVTAPKVEHMNSTTELYTMSDIQEHFKGNVSVGASIPIVAAFTASASYDQFEQTVRKNRSTQTIVSTEKRDFRVLVTMANCPLDANFRQAVEKLGAEKNMAEFINLYGTHYPEEVDLGGRYLETFIVTNTAFMNVINDGGSVSVGAEGTYKSVTGQVLSENEKKNAEIFEKKVDTSTRNVMVEGGKAQLENHLDDWLDTTAENPVVQKLVLRGVWEVFSHSALKDIPNIEETQAELQTYVTEQLADPALQSGFTFSFVDGTEVWNDSGSGGTYDGAFYVAKHRNIPAGYRAIGGYGQNNHHRPVLSLVVLKPLLPHVMEEANFYAPIYTDRGSGAQKDGSFWWPFYRKDTLSWRDPGYVPVGVLPSSGHDTPPTGAASVVKVEYTAKANLGDFIWNDNNTGASSDFGCWEILPSADEGNTVLCNAFWGWGAKSKPQTGSPPLTCVPPLTPTTVSNWTKPTAPVFRMQPQRQFQLAWNDKGSGGDSDGSFWTTVPPEEYFSVGDLGCSGYSNEGQIVMCLQALDGQEDASPAYHMLANDFVKIYDDSGSGADMNGSFWWPVVKDAEGWLDMRYVPLGVVAVKGHGKPTQGHNIHCIRCDLCVASQIGAYIWNDKGTGAKSDFAAFKISGANGVALGTFFASATYNPTPNATLFAPYAIASTYVQQ